MYTLRNCTILTVDSGNRFYPQGCMVIDQGLIKEIGTEEEITPQGEVIDLNGALVMPGLVNAHTHSHSSLFRNQADDLRLMDWLKKAMWPMEKGLTADLAYAATMLSCVEYIRGGITTYADQFYYADTIAGAARASGLRCFLAATVFTKPSPETDDTFQAAVRFIEKWTGKEEQTLVYPCIGPHAPYSVSADLFREIVRLSEAYDLLIHTHISETMDENEQLLAQTGMSPTRWLESLGVFERPVLAAHCVFLDEEDLDIFRDRNVSVVYNPVSNMKLASGILNYPEICRRGIPVSIGTDGAQSNNSMDLLRDLRTGLLLQKVVHKDATLISAEEGIRMATINGAKALRMENRIGSLERGKAADLIALDPGSPRLTPLHRNSLKNLYAAVVYSSCGADVKDVMVQGRWVMRDRKILSVNESQVLENGQKASEQLLKSAGMA